MTAPLKRWDVVPQATEGTNLMSVLNNSSSSLSESEGGGAAPSRTATLKYPLKVGDILVDKGTIVELSSLEDIRKAFPNADVNPNSEYSAIKVLDIPCFVVLKKQLNFT